jgi:uncharacterized repeat protein (TIGR02543 family)
MVLYVKKNSTTWKTATSIFVKAGATGWSSVKKIYVKAASGTWKLVYGSSGPDLLTSLDINANSYNYTGSNNIYLTGTNYHWASGSSITLKYDFFKSADGNTYYPMYYVSGSPSAANFQTYTPGNPSSGSYNTIRYPVSPNYLSISDFPASPAYFIFSIQATDNVGTTNASSGLISISVSDPTIPDPTWGGSNIAGGQLTFGTSYGSGTVTNIKAYITRSDGKVVLDDTGPKNGYTITDGTSTVTNNTGYYYLITTTNADNGYTFSGYIKAYSVPGTNTFTTNTVTSSAVIGTYSFAFGNTLYPSTNGQIGLYNGYSFNPPASGKSVVVWGADLYQQSMGYWSDDRYFVIQFSGWAYGHTNDPLYALRYQARFDKNNPSYVDVLICNKGSSLPQPTYTGYYSDSTLVAGITGPHAAFVTNSTYRIYVNGTLGTASGISVPQIPSADFITTSLTSGSLDDGYTAITSATNQYTPSYFLNTSGTTTSSSLNFSFTGNIDYSYYYYRLDTGSYGGTNVSNAYATANPLIVTGLSAGTTYYLTIVPYNSQGQAGTTYQNTFTTQSNLTAPTIGTITGVAGNISVPFTGGSGPYYQVTWYSTNTYNNTSYDANGSSSPISVTNLALPGSTTWYFYIRSVSALTNTGTGPSTTISSWSSPVSWTAPQYTVTWDATTNGGTSGTSSSSAYSGNSVTAPSATRSGYTFNGWFVASSGGSSVVSSGASYTPTANITLYAQFTRNVVTPTITTPTYTNITQTTGTINWTSTNQASYALDGSFSDTGTTGTSVAKTGLTAGTTYSGNVTVTSSTGDAASKAYSFTTSSIPTPGTPTVTNGTVTSSSWSIDITFGSDTGSVKVQYGTSTSYGSTSAAITSGGTYTPTGPFAANTTYYYKVTPYSNTNGTGTAGTAATGSIKTAAAFVTPTCIAPSLAFQPRSYESNTLKWYCDYPTPSGSVSYIVGMDFEIRTTAGGGTLLASGTRTYPGAGTYPYAANGNIWAFRMGTADGDISYSASARYGRARVQMMGTNGTTYYGTWSGWL